MTPMHTADLEARRLQNGTENSKIRSYKRNVRLSGGLFAGSLGVVALAQVLPAAVMVGTVILAWTMMAAAAAVVCRLIYIFWKDPFSVCDNQPVSEVRADSAKQIHDAVKLPVENRIEHSRPLNIGTMNDPVSELTLMQYTPKDMEILLREAMAEQERMRCPARARTPRSKGLLDWA